MRNETNHDLEMDELIKNCAELARLREVNQALVEALRGLVALCGRTGYHPTDEYKAAEAALALAEKRQ